MAAGLVSGKYYDLLGVPAAGRARRGRQQRAERCRLTGCVAVISDGFWHRRFERSREAVGRPIRLRGRDFTIIGVAPAGFFGREAGQVVDILLPMRPLTARGRLESQTVAWITWA